jgi:uncharacterized SAM-binding protein YcdF (DUF218 family)
MFFTLSKVFWFFVNPGNLLLIALCLGAALLLTRWRWVGRWLLGFAVFFALLAATLPFGRWLILPLENRFPIVPQLPERVDGIITLGGVVNQFVTQARGQIAIDGGAERLVELSVLARRYPEAKLIFSGGSGRLFRQDVKEADVLGPLFDTLALDTKRVVLDSQSRNTFENASATHRLANPGPGETWILITSAFHMPRSVGTFRKAGWRIIPYPVDFSLQGNEGFDLSFNLISGLSGLDSGLHEWLGLISYWLMGKTDSIFPAPEG